MCNEIKIVKKEKRHGTAIALLLSIFIVSVSLFAYQVTLTRLYSAILSYHYVFLATSLAILGIGIGSIWAYRGGSRKSSAAAMGPAQPQKALIRTNKLAFVLSCGFVAVFVLIYVQPFVDSLAVFTILGIIPFVISGYLYSMLFRAWSQASGKLYFADLVGGAAGSVAVVFLLNNAGMLRTAALICLLPLAAAFILPAANKRLRAAQCAAAILLAACVFLPARFANSVETSFYGLFSNSGKEYGAMERAGLSPEIAFSRWDSFARTDLMKMEAIPDTMFLIIDGGATAPMFEYDGTAGSLDKFKTDNGYVPFILGEADKTLLIGVGGGLDVLYAIAAGSGDITAVEINKASIEAVRLFGDYNGHIFDMPGVRVHGEDGRGFVRNAGERFDLIFFSIVVTNTTQGAGFALSENYLYTVEAIEEYLDLLSENGRIAFVAHDQNAIDKLTATAIQALMNRGVPFEEAPGYLATYYKLAGAGSDPKVFDPVIIIKNRPFSEAESRILENEVSSRGALPAYIPHLHEQGMLLQVKSGQVASLDGFVDGFHINAGPSRDDSPYFFNFDRKINTGLLQILGVSLLGSLLLFAVSARGKRGCRAPVYFGLLGMGFMMIEVPLIQKFILFLGHPTPAFSYILSAMLVGCGIGGFFSGHGPFRKTYARLYMPPIFAAMINVAILLSLSQIFRQASGLDLAAKVAVSALIAMSAGFFMGMPFPRGLALLGESGRNGTIPLMWGINGAMSVAGSALSLILSMAFGFSAALAAGAAVYLAIGLFRKV